MSTSSPQKAIQLIERFSRRDPGARGLATHAPPDLLWPAASELLGGERIIIVTGFCIRAAMAGETDGPPGALCVAETLRRLGKQVFLLSDSFSAPLLVAGSAVYGQAIPAARIDLPQASADAVIDDLLTAFAPTHVLAIERPGNAVDGHRYSMRGEMLDDLVASADRLLSPPGARAYATLAIGDGGNELGLGGLRERLRGQINRGELIFSATPADHVIPAGISNWGAYALSAALAVLSGRPLLQPAAHERAVLEAMIGAGAVDGCTRQRELSVDGLAWGDYAGTLEDIHRETGRYLAEQSAAAAHLADGMA